MTPDEIRAAAAVHSELGPEYQDAVVDSFLDKVGKEIDARVDARLNQQYGPQQYQQQQQYPQNAPRFPPANGPQPFGPQAYGPYPAPGRPQRAFPRDTTLPLAIVSMVLGIPLTAIVAGNGLGLAGILIIWIAITAINVAHNLHQRRS